MTQNHRAERNAQAEQDLQAEPDTQAGSDRRTRPNRSGATADWLPRLLAGLAILSQIAWPLTSGDVRVLNTLVVVALFAAASVSHAIVHLGIRWATSAAAICLIFGLAIERLGVATGWPFSPYEYSDLLQPQILDVPLVVPLAWTMMTYPALILARALAAGWLGRVLLGAYALAAWDLFLDPQMVGEGYWRWTSQLPGLPGIAEIPMVNYLGWLFAAFVLMAALSVLPARSVPLDVPAALYGWMWLGGVIANAFFFHRPAVALWGGVFMGVAAVPFVRRALLEWQAP